MHGLARPATGNATRAPATTRAGRSLATTGLALAFVLGAAAAVVACAPRASVSGRSPPPGATGTPAASSIASPAAAPPGPGEERLVVSHEDPAFDVASSGLAVGRDGRVLLASDRYVMRMRRDGTERRGAAVTYATAAAAANAAG